MLDAAFLAACAPMVAHETTAKVIMVESAGNPLAINVNRFAGPQPRPRTPEAAIETAERFIRDGYSVDIGAMQVNSRNLGMLGVTVQDLFLNPCKAIAAGAVILGQCYARAVQSRGEGQAALKAALSCYNTGNMQAGFRNGYVAKYVPSIRFQPPLQAAARASNPETVKAAQAALPAWGGLVAHTWEQAIGSQPMTTQASSWTQGR